MTYFCVDKDGTERCSNECPIRGSFRWESWTDMYGTTCHIIRLPEGSIERLTGHKITWENEPLKVNKL